MKDQLLYEIGLTLITGIGAVTGKKLIAYCGGAEAVFCEKKKALLQLPGIGEHIVKNIVSQNVLSRAEKEINFICKNNIKPLFYMDIDYPKRLEHCPDGPLMLYYKGEADLNVEHVIGVVGTRNPTDYGKYLADKIVNELASDNVLVISGLAYGIDTCAHQAALKYNLKTVAVLGHGFQTIYPAANKKLAYNILYNGGLLTENISGTQPDRENFPKRNRIVAGMVDCVIVVESALKGGALITAEIANSYDRDVFAFPGRVDDIYSEGCNYLIKNNKANIITNSNDIRFILRWDTDTKVVNKQMRMFRDFSPEEKQVMDVFNDNDVIHLDKILTDTDLSSSKIASILLSLEFDGILIALPGKRYQKI